MFKNYLRWSAGALAGGALAAAAIMGALVQGSGSAYASDASSNYYAGDVNGLALPTGTFVAIEYLVYQHSGTFVDPTGKQFKGAANADAFLEGSRFAYFSKLWDHPLVFEAAFTFAKPTDVNVPPAGGVQDIAAGFGDPQFFIDYGLIVDPKNERFLGFTNYLYVPGRRYDNTRGVNVSSPGQFTWVPQFQYAEGLGKFSPALKNFWFDLAGDMSVHSDGDSPVSKAPIPALLFPGGQYDKLTQDNSYDVKAFLRYNYNPLGFVAVGIEKSWGGKQTASGGVLSSPLLTPFGLGPNKVLGKDDYLRGHFEVQVPLSPSFAVAAEIAHDFEAEGGFKQDVVAQIRLTKAFLPSAEPLK